MGFTLIFSRKVQVNIRLLIPLKPQKGLKRNVKAVLYQVFPAYRTDLIRKVTACVSRICLNLRRIKITVMAGRTPVVGA